MRARAAKFSENEIFGDALLVIFGALKTCRILPSRLSEKTAVMTLTEPLELLTNLKMNIGGVDKKLAIRDFYGKVIECSEENGYPHTICFTSIPPDIDAYFQSHRQHADKSVV